MNDRTGSEDAEGLVRWAVQDLSETIGFDAAWYGWANLRADGVEVWKHGVELRVQGSYADLTSYLSELERLPQRLIWGEVRLKAEYPRSELHLKIYTYSLDQAWLRL